MNNLELHAREILNLPPEWQGYEFSCLPQPIDGQPWKPTHLRIRGAIAPLKTRGKNKGHPNWRKLDKTTLREFITSIPKHEAWKVEWERKNHSCWRCHGQKQIVASISIATGTTYRPCPRCLGSGVFSPSQASTPEPAGVPQKLEKTHTGENG